MARDLDIIERQLELGQVKTISHDDGKIIDYVELLFSPITKVQFAPSDDMKNIRLSVSDNNLELPQLDCIISKSVLRSFIISLKNIYNELLDDDYVN